MFYHCKIVLLGENISLENFSEFNVVGVIGKCNGNLPIYTYNYLLKLPRDTKIIIVDDNWDFEITYEFHTLITKLGLIIGEDYIYHSMLQGKININRIYQLFNEPEKDFPDIMKKILGDRKLVILHGNCQVHVLINMLGSNPEFKQKYVTSEMPKLWGGVDEDEKLSDLIESGVFRLAEFFFTQKISNENRFGYIVSTEQMVSLLSDSCQIVTIANLYFRGYFPQLRLDEEVYDWWNKNGKKQKFPNYSGRSDREVIKLIAEGKGDEEIVNEISAADYYSSEELKKKIELELADYQSREKDIDIKMGDFLADNYDKFLMFATENHPTRDVLIEFARRILRKLGIHSMDIVCDEREVQSPCPRELFYTIYPSVLKALGLGERQYYFRASLHERELVVLSGINEHIDQLIRECRVLETEEKEFIIESKLDFKNYMLIYIRILRAVMQL